MWREFTWLIFQLKWGCWFDTRNRTKYFQMQNGQLAFLNATCTSTWTKYVISLFFVFVLNISICFENANFIFHLFFFGFSLCFKYLCCDCIWLLFCWRRSFILIFCMTLLSCSARLQGLCRRGTIWACACVLINARQFFNTSMDGNWPSLWSISQGKKLPCAVRICLLVFLAEFMFYLWMTCAFGLAVAEKLSVIIT